MLLKLLRITTVPISLDLLLTDQMAFMKSKGFEVLMVSADGPERERVRAREGCEHVVIPFTRKITPFKDLVCLIKLISLIKKEKPDIVHTHTPKAGLLGMLAAKVCGVKVKLHTVAGLPLMTASGLKKKVFISMEQLTAWAADVILPNSHSLMQYMKDQKLVSDQKLSIIGKGSTNGIDLSRFSINQLGPAQLDKIKSSISYDESNTYLLSIGRLVRDKGIVELINAFQSLKLKRENLKLILLGPLEKIRSEELLPSDTLLVIQNDPDIIHINWSDDVECFLSLADVFIQASHREGFPNVTLQAGAMECPIVCSKIPGNIDIVADGETGFYFEKGNALDLERKVLCVLNSVSKTKVMSQVLRKQIEMYFDRKEIHNQLLAFYKSQLAI